MLSTYAQKEESIDEYILELLLLAKECNFQTVDAMWNWDNSVRDTFITGLHSNIIRQWLLENRSLGLNTAIDQARALYTAQKNSECYLWPFQPVGATTIKNSDISAALNNTESPCYFCNGPHHDHQNCLTRESMCHRCNKINLYSAIQD